MLPSASTHLQYQGLPEGSRRVDALPHRVRAAVEEVCPLQLDRHGIRADLVVTVQQELVAVIQQHCKDNGYYVLVNCTSTCQQLLTV